MLLVAELYEYLNAFDLYTINEGLDGMLIIFSKNTT